MPIYLYRAVNEGCEHCRDGFEVLQGLGEEPIVRCPRCGRPVRRVPAPFATGRGDLLSDSNLRRHGFQKLRRTEEGTYRREV